MKVTIRAELFETTMYHDPQSCALATTLKEMKLGEYIGVGPDDVTIGDSYYRIDDNDAIYGMYKTVEDGFLPDNVEVELIQLN